MSSSRRTAVLGTFGLLMLIGSADACAQNAGTLHYEYKEKIDQARNISPLGLDLFGDVDRPEFCRHSVAALRVAPFKLYR